MPNRMLAAGLSRLPGLRRLPVFRLLAVAEIAMLARTHFAKLDADERRRLVELVRTGRGRSDTLAPADREELAKLVAKLEPRRFLEVSVGKLSPIPLPRRFTDGR